ncbi:MAG: phospholipase [Candidatus Omnitrophica bacterium]|nr:phospholipase [Candidatus Omnitrophota bacterium]
MEKTYFLILIFVLAIGCLSADQNLIHKSIKVDGVERTYLLRIFSSYNGEKSVPLVFVLHGGGGNGKQMMNFTSFENLSEKDCFIVVYPDAYRKNWNDARNFLSSTIDDVKFFKMMIEQISGEWKIDRKRIYATGISNGAMMCYTLACRMSESFAAIAAVAGNHPENLKDQMPASPVNVMIINGTKDPLVPYNGGAIKVFGRERGRVLSTDETLRFWIKANDCTEQISSVQIPDRIKNDGSTVLVQSFRNPVNDVEVVLCKIENGGHTWPGTIQYLPESIVGKTNRDINATGLIWEFFKKHKKEIK